MKKENQIKIFILFSLVFLLSILLCSFVFAETLNFPKPPASPTNYKNTNDSISTGGSGSNPAAPNPPLDVFAPINTLRDKTLPQVSTFWFIVIVVVILVVVGFLVNFLRLKFGKDDENKGVEEGKGNSKTIRKEVVKK